MGGVANVTSKGIFIRFDLKQLPLSLCCYRSFDDISNAAENNGENSKFIC
jgi:hypothetical protein